MDLERVVLGSARAQKQQLKSTVVSGPIDQLAWSPNDDKVILSGIVDGVTVWDPEGTVTPLETGKDSQHSGLAMSPCGRWAAGGDSDNVVTLFDLHQEKASWCFRNGPAQTARSAPNFCRQLAFSQDGSYLLTGDGDELVRVWKIEPDGGVALSRGLPVEGAVTGFGFSPDGSRLAVGTTAELTLYDFESGEALRRFPELGSFETRVSDQGMVAVLTTYWEEGVRRPESALKHQVVAVDLTRLEKVRSHRLEGSSMAFAPESNELYVGDRNKNGMTRWSVELGYTVAYDFSSAEDLIGGVSSIAFSNDGKKLAVACGFDRLKLFDARDDEPEQPDEIDLELGDDWMMVGDYVLERH